MAERISILFVSGFSADTNNLMTALKRHYYCQDVQLKDFPSYHKKADGLVIDVDLTDPAAVDAAARGIRNFDRSHTFLAAVIDPYREEDRLTAKMLGVDEVIPLIKIRRLAANTKADSRNVSQIALLDFVEIGRKTIDWLALKSAQPKSIKSALEAGEAALRSILRPSPERVPTAEEMADASHAISTAIDTYGLGVWINMVKSHHSATYQHCLTVSGLAAALGARLGFNKADLELLTVSSLFHDIGKSLIPLEILEKPTSLTADENIKFREHPTLGLQIIAKSESFEPQILKVIGDHHEYLDASGYPNKLSGAEISDLTRLITVCDVFSYLTERRPNKLGLPSAHAYGYLSAMTKQLDVSLVKAFKIVADDVE